MTYINNVGEIVDKVLVDGRVGGVHAKDVLVAGFQGLEMGVVVFGPALGDFFFDQLEFFRFFQLFASDGRFQLLALSLDVSQFGFSLSLFHLVHLRRLHGCV